MAVGDPYSRMINMMRSQGAHKNGFQMERATVIGTEPLIIKVNEVAISKNVFCNEVINSNEKLEEILVDEKGISEALKTFLKDTYTKTRLEVGDTVLVQRVDNSFYVLEKVVGIS